MVYLLAAILYEMVNLFLLGHLIFENSTKVKALISILQDAMAQKILGASLVTVVNRA